MILATRIPTPHTEKSQVILEAGVKKVLLSRGKALKKKIEGELKKSPRHMTYDRIDATFV